MEIDPILPDVIPVFPLSGAVLLPRSRVPLHIFEPRYVAMLGDVIGTPGRIVGMIQPNEIVGRGGTGLMVIGCAGRITQFSETDDGRYMITLKAVSRYRIVDEVQTENPYRMAKVSWDGFERDRGGADHDHGFDRAQLTKLLERYFATKKKSADWDALRDAPDELLINSLSMLMDFSPEDKQALLEAPSLTTRRETLVTLIEYALYGGAAEGNMQ